MPSPRDLLATLAPMKKSLLKLSRERNLTTLREVLAGVGEEGPIRMVSSRRRCSAPRWAPTVMVVITADAWVGLSWGRMITGGSGEGRGSSKHIHGHAVYPGSVPSW